MATASFEASYFHTLSIFWGHKTEQKLIESKQRWKNVGKRFRVWVMLILPLRIFFALFLEQLDCVLQGHESSISHDELINRSRDQSISDYVVMFFRFVTSGEIQKRSEVFEPFILGLTNATVEQVCSILELVIFEHFPLSASCHCGL
ncbi:hypothetical protein P3X46_005681 [Hevea brasiliensis]|uniref:Retrotransposon gag domain-containing protein n=1 Tax=Hevea brasiliensis TaxID=3981 RepID=A0ABQ9N1C5_HEVBR|nr:hypothetical protein P3X46_005681 [Hevea brasiliensis]